MHNIVTTVNSVLNIWKLLTEYILKLFITRKKCFVNMHGDDHLAKNTNNESWCCTPENIIMFYMSIISQLKKRGSYKQLC